MSITQSALVLEIRENLDEDIGPGKWQDTHIRKWINEGMREIARRTETLLDKETINVVAGTDVYNLPADLIRVHRVDYTEGADNIVYPLDMVNLNSLDSFGWGMRTTGRPVACAAWGTNPMQITVFPKPDQTATITVWYYRLPVELATDGTAGSTPIDLPEGWTDVVKDYVEYRARRRDRDPMWQDAKGLYEDKVQDLIEQTRVFHDQVGQMMPSSSGNMVPRHLWDPDW